MGRKETVGEDVGEGVGEVYGLLTAIDCLELTGSRMQRTTANSGARASGWSGREYHSAGLRSD